MGSKKFLIDDEYSIGTEEAVVPVGNKKKGKKGGSRKMEQKDDDDELGDSVVPEDEDEDAPVIGFGGKKKRKTKTKKSASSSGFSAFGLLGEDENGDDPQSKDEDDDEELGVPAISFTGEGGADDPEEEILAVKFSGKKKSSKRKNVSDDTATETGIGNAPSDIVEPNQHGGDSKDKQPNGEEVASKIKKKKKKGGKHRQEDEENLDKLLAEFGAVPSSEAPVAPPRSEKLRNKPEQEEVPGESVTSKKKKKRKEKEKKPSTSAVEETTEEVKNEINSKTASKKVPNHVREMQEKLARVKEAEERKKQEEEERLRKEAVERLKQEEMERLAEEKKRLKKEREKEKLFKKKQEGKLLTGKQKEEARRLESMRKQILANVNLDLSVGDSSGAPAKRPLYQKKRSNPQNPSNGAATISEDVESADSKGIHQDAASELDYGETENVEEVESSGARDKAELNDAVEDNGVGDEEEDDEDWDAQSWDDGLKLPGRSVFTDEEVNSEPEPLPKRDLKNRGSASEDAEPHARKPTGVAASVMPRKPENLDVQTNRNNKKNPVKEEKSKPDIDPVQNEQSLRSPICCIMGHVDAGKTKLLDFIRGTNVQEGEAGGITQQIGATYFPAENIRERTRELKADAKLNVPGLLVIDTPGHGSFTNMRSRGSGLCDLAILVVDIMDGLKQQTIESLNLLKMGNTDFIIALNKVDRLYGWKTCRNAPIGKAIKQQTKDVMIEFDWRLIEIITQFKEQGINTQLYYKNKEMGETYNIVPTSAISGEGVPDLLLLLVQWAQKTMVKRLTYSEQVQCTILEVKFVEGLGITIDVVLINGVLHEGDQIVVCGKQGAAVVTTIRALLTPHPMKELRVKGSYLHHKEIKAAQGIKIAAQGLEHAIAGTSLYVVGAHDDVEVIKEVAMEDVESVTSFDKSGEGVCVQASTLGSLEALLKESKNSAVNIPVSTISIGPVHKKDVNKAITMLEKKKEYGTILAFDVEVTPDAKKLAGEHGVKIFSDDSMYHLFDQFKAHIDKLKEEKKREAAKEAVFPCKLRIKDCYYKKDPILLCVDVIEGNAKIGTPLCVPQKGFFIDIGLVASIENNHKPVDYAKKGQEVAIKIIGQNPEEQQKMFGRHFGMKDELVSKISRRSLDALKEYYADDLSPEDVRLLGKLKKVFQIP